MKRLVNFAHPLSEDAKKEIAAIVGDFEELGHPAQFDLSKRLHGQVADLAVEASLQDADLVIPPALSAAACLLAAHFQPGKWPRVVWLKRADSLPPSFVLGGIE